MHIQEQMKETTEIIMNLLNQRMKHDMELLCSIKGIGENTAMNFLIEMGGHIEMYENDKKLIAASGLDPSTYKSGKYEGKSRISKRGNRHLRRVIWLMATKVIINNNLFSYFYKRRNEGLPYKMAVLATAHKLIRIMFVMLSPQNMENSFLIYSSQVFFYLSIRHFKAFCRVGGCSPSLL